MRPGVLVLILLAAMLGAAFGALNADLISLDVYFASIRLPKGAALLVALLIGWVLGGLLVWFVRVRSLRRELRKARRALAAMPATESASGPGAAANGR